MKQYSPTGRRNHGRPLKRLLDAWDRNGSTSGPTPWKIDDDDDVIQSPWEWRKNFSLKVKKKHFLQHCVKTRKTIIWVTRIFKTPWFLVFRILSSSIPERKTFFFFFLISQRAGQNISLAVFDPRTLYCSSYLRQWSLFYCDSPWSWLCPTIPPNSNHRIAYMHHVLYGEFSTKHLMLCHQSYTAVMWVGCFVRCSKTLLQMHKSLTVG